MVCPKQIAKFPSAIFVMSSCVLACTRWSQIQRRTLWFALGRSSMIDCIMPMHSAMASGSRPSTDSVQSHKWAVRQEEERHSRSACMTCQKALPGKSPPGISRSHDLTSEQMLWISCSFRLTARPEALVSLYLPRWLERNPTCIVIELERVHCHFGAGYTIYQWFVYFGGILRHITHICQSRRTLFVQLAAHSPPEFEGQPLGEGLCHDRVRPNTLDQLQILDRWRRLATAA